MVYNEWLDRSPCKLQPHHINVVLENFCLDLNLVDPWREAGQRSEVSLSPGLNLMAQLSIDFWLISDGLMQNNVKQKKLKVDKQEVEIRQGMTAAALAVAMNRDFDHVLEALLNTPADLDSLRPDSVLEDSWIKEAVIRSGMKFRWAKLSESRERPNRDAQRRYRGFCSKSRLSI
uniref:Uncharacterized protein n=1 Tax=Xiphophorus couchianus TaxID=32473 RepID=A0A3B5LRA8_9TELE